MPTNGSRLRSPGFSHEWLVEELEVMVGNVMVLADFKARIWCSPDTDAVEFEVEDVRIMSMVDSEGETYVPDIEGLRTVSRAAKAHAEGSDRLEEALTEVAVENGYRFAGPRALAM